MNNNKPEFLFIHGLAYTGKSSIIKTLLEGKAEGIIVGHVITKRPYTRPIRAMIGGREFIIQDTVAWDKYDMKISSQDYRDLALASLIESGQHSAKIILAENMFNNDLAKSFLNLAQAYSQDVKESTFVVYTRAHKPLSQKELEKRYRELNPAFPLSLFVWQVIVNTPDVDLFQDLKNKSKILGLPFMSFKTDCELTKGEREEQNNQLLHLIDNVKPYQIPGLKAHHELIEKEAKDRFDALEMIGKDCKVEFRKLSESRSGIDTGIAGAAIGAPFSIYGALAGFAIGILLGKSEAVHKEYNVC